MRILILGVGGRMGHAVAQLALAGARGVTDVGAKEVFFEYNALESYPERMYLNVDGVRVRVR